MPKSTSQAPRSHKTCSLRCFRAEQRFDPRAKGFAVLTSVMFCCMDRLIPQPILDALAIPVEHNLLRWMLVGGVAEVRHGFFHPGRPFSHLPNSLIPNTCAQLLATISLTTYAWHGGWQWHGSFSHCPGAPFAGTLVFNLAWWTIFNTAMYLWFYKKEHPGWRMSSVWPNIFT